MVELVSSVGRQGRAAAFGAAVAMAAFGSTAAFAKEPIAPACLSAGSEIAQLRCSIALSKKATAGFEARTKAAEARGAAADARATAADARLAAQQMQAINLKKSITTADASKSCYDSLTLEVRAAKRIAPLTPEQKNAFRARAAECEHDVFLTNIT